MLTIHNMAVQRKLVDGFTCNFHFHPQYGAYFVQWLDPTMCYEHVRIMPSIPENEELWNLYDEDAISTLKGIINFKTKKKSNLIEGAPQ